MEDEIVLQLRWEHILIIASDGADECPNVAGSTARR